MKKRIASLAAAALMVFSFAGCQSQNPIDLLQSAAAKTKTLPAVEYDATVGVDVDMQGMTMGIDMDMNLKAVNDEKDPDFEYTMSMELMGQSMDINMKYIDGWCYMDAGNGAKSKMEMDLEKFKEKQGSLFNLTEFEMEPEYLKDMKVTKSGDNTVISFEADSKFAQDILDSVLGSMGDDAAALEDANMKISGVSGEFTVDREGYLAGEKITMDCEVSSMGQSMTMKMTMDFTLKNPGQEITIKVDEPDSYEEYDLSDELLEDDFLSDDSDSTDF